MTTVKTRTRKAILESAMKALGQNPNASMGQIAAAAEVGRTTLHRYFAERSDLINALANEGFERIKQATDRAEIGKGPAIDALNRLYREYFELGDLLILIAHNPNLLADTEWSTGFNLYGSFEDLIRRGHAEGTVHPLLTAEWIQDVMWSLVYTAWDHAIRTKTPKNQVLDMALRTFANAIAE